jgi:hypothetical protein
MIPVGDYLADAGILARPRRYRWFIRVPEAFDSADAFHQDLHEAINATTPAQASCHPVNWDPLIQGVVQGVTRFLLRTSGLAPEPGAWRL